LLTSALWRSRQLFRNNTSATYNTVQVIVMPAQPFLDWLHRADPTSAELKLEDLRREPTIYLLPKYDTEDEARGNLR